MLVSFPYIFLIICPPFPPAHILCCTPTGRYTPYVGGSSDGEAATGEAARGRQRGPALQLRCVPFSDHLTTSFLEASGVTVIRNGGSVSAAAVEFRVLLQLRTGAAAPEVRHAMIAQGLHGSRGQQLDDARQAALLTTAGARTLSCHSPYFRIAASFVRFPHRCILCQISASLHPLSGFRIAASFVRFPHRCILCQISTSLHPLSDFRIVASFVKFPHRCILCQISSSLHPLSDIRIAASFVRFPHRCILCQISASLHPLSDFRIAASFVRFPHRCILCQISASLHPLSDIRIAASFVRFPHRCILCQISASLHPLSDFRIAASLVRFLHRCILCQISASLHPLSDIRIAASFVRFPHRCILCQISASLHPLSDIRIAASFVRFPHRCILCQISASLHPLSDFRIAASFVRYPHRCILCQISASLHPLSDFRIAASFVRFPHRCILSQISASLHPLSDFRIAASFVRYPHRCILCQISASLHPLSDFRIAASFVRYPHRCILCQISASLHPLSDFRIAASFVRYPHRCILWLHVGRGGRWGSARASRGIPLVNPPPFHSLQHGGQRGDDTAGGTDGGEVLLYRCSGVSLSSLVRFHLAFFLFYALHVFVVHVSLDPFLPFVSLPPIPFHSLQVYLWDEEGEGAARAHQEASLCLTPPSIPFSMSGSVETTRRAARMEVRCCYISAAGSTRGTRRVRGSARASRGVPLLNPPFHSLQHVRQRGDYTAGGTDGGEVLLYRCSGVSLSSLVRFHLAFFLFYALHVFVVHVSLDPFLPFVSLPPIPFHSLQVYLWDEEGEGAARAHQEASLCLTPPSIPFSMSGSVETTRRAARMEVRCCYIAAAGTRASRGVPLLNPPFHSLQHGGQRGDDTAGGTDGGEVLLHRCSGVSLSSLVRFRLAFVLFYALHVFVVHVSLDPFLPFVSLPPTPFLSLQVYSWDEEGEGAARAHQEASLCLTPPSIPFSMAGSVETTRRAARTEVRCCYIAAAG
ncbi:unnamed protein product [Closterium sp. Yama58-4]|nr:unnamed protein product [Closterium sp. Yama58-4]